MLRSKRLGQQIEAVEAFRDAFERHFAAQATNQEVAELSGPASIAANEAGVAIMLPVAMGQHVINPIQAWESAVLGIGFPTKDTVTNSCGQTIGILRQRLAEAQSRERSLAGRVARVVRFPYDVREAVADDHPQAGRVAFGAGVVAQIVAGVLTALAVTAITAAVAALWRAV